MLSNETNKTAWDFPNQTKQECLLVQIPLSKIESQDTSIESLM